MRTVSPESRASIISACPPDPYLFFPANRPSGPLEIARQGSLDAFSATATLRLAFRSAKLDSIRQRREADRKALGWGVATVFTRPDR